MAYTYTNSKGQKYILHSRQAGKNSKGRLFFFAKEEKEGSESKLPDGYIVTENPKTKVPIVKKKNS